MWAREFRSPEVSLRAGLIHVLGQRAVQRVTFGAYRQMKRLIEVVVCLVMMVLDNRNFVNYFVCQWAMMLQYEGIRPIDTPRIRYLFVKPERGDRGWSMCGASLCCAKYFMPVRPFLDLVMDSFYMAHRATSLLTPSSHGYF